MIARDARVASRICPLRSIFPIFSSITGIALMDEPRSTAPTPQPASTSPMKWTPRYARERPMKRQVTAARRYVQRLWMS
ncbi:MAG: hypothetical protein A4E49_03392 [Methanosaeta sp. PtaU1.Bin112]|nr:MAG: hypothetical protein A4E49_03392 [Methanosaeta sp. PtaU1.Bin112]